MRLAFDLDGTVADMHSALAREARRLFPDIDPSAVPRSVSPDGNPAEGDTGAPQADDSRLSIGNLSSRQQRELWKAVCDQENWWETLDEIEPGSLARLYRLVCDRKWELMFVTSRPETRGDTAQAQSYRWLAARGYETPSIFVVHGSRGKIASALALDVLVDDRPENCLDVAIDSSARAILVWRGDEGKVPASARQLGIGSVSSIHECLDILESLNRPETEGAGVIDRLKRLLGLKSAERGQGTGQRAGLSRPQTTAR
ncbi:MAG: hypothetical protein AB7H96_14350 [Vicinamibacterales bacterium]